LFYNWCVAKVTVTLAVFTDPLLSSILRIDSMTHYLIEYRFQGRAKAEIRQMISELDNRFHLGILKSKRAIPHISLAGPLTTNNEARLIKDFTALCKSTPFCSFNINGFENFKDSRVVYIKIVPSPQLDKFRWDLSQKLAPYCTLRDFDYNRDFKFHATLAMKLDHQDFCSVKSFIERQNPPNFKQFLIRATIIKNNKIMYEYDFLQRKLLNRSDALDRKILAKTMKLLNDFFKGKFDPDRIFDTRFTTENHQKKTADKANNLGIINRIKKIFGEFF